MTEADFGRLFDGLRVVAPLGALLLLGEWVAGLTFIPLVFRWGIPVIQRRIDFAEPSPRSGRIETSSLVLVPLSPHSWMFRAPFKLLGVSTPFPLHGLAQQSAGALHIVGRHPIGGLVFFVSAIGSAVLAELAPLFVRSLAQSGFAVEWSRVGVYLAFAMCLYGISLLIERVRFLKAVADLVPVLAGSVRR